MPQGISINLQFPLKATADARANNNSVAEKAFQLYRIQCIKSAEMSLKWTVSRLYCHLAFQPFKYSVCITVEKITEAWAAMWAFRVLFMTSQSCLLFSLFRKTTYLLYHCPAIVSLPCPLLPISSHFVFVCWDIFKHRTMCSCNNCAKIMEKSPLAYRRAASQWSSKCYCNAHLTGHPWLPT